MKMIFYDNKKLTGKTIIKKKKQKFSYYCINIYKRRFLVEKENYVYIYFNAILIKIRLEI